MSKRKTVLIDDVEEHTTDDCVLDHMYANLPPEKWTLETYLELAYWDGRTVDDLDGEELSMLPPELYPVPESKHIQ
jgi:hypothetical protein